MLNEDEISWMAGNCSTLEGAQVQPSVYDVIMEGGATYDTYNECISDSIMQDHLKSAFSKYAPYSPNQPQASKNKATKKKRRCWFCDEKYRKQAHKTIFEYKK